MVTDWLTDVSVLLLMTKEKILMYKDHGDSLCQTEITVNFMHLLVHGHVWAITDQLCPPYSINEPFPD